MQKSQHLVVFFGTPEFAVSILEKLAASPYRPALVVTAPDKPAGRKQLLTSPPVKVTAEKFDIPVFQPTTRKELAEGLTLRGGSDPPALFIVAAYGKILPKEVLDIPKHGTLNVHPSLLPKLRGPSPVQYALLNGDVETGVSIILLDAQMDHGPILAQQKIEIGESETAETLSVKLADLSGELLLQIIPVWLAEEITPREQNHEEATYTKIIVKEDGRINWHKSAADIERIIRAYTPWPSAYALYNDKRIIIRAACAANLRQEHSEPGKIVAFEDTFAIQTGANILVPARVQYEGKNEQSAQEFLRGHPQIIGATLQ